MFGARFFGARYFGPRYFGEAGLTPSAGGPFGHRYFGVAFFGPRYFAPAGSVVPPVTGDLPHNLRFFCDVGSLMSR